MHEISSTEISPSLESEAVNSTSAGEFHEKIVRKERKPKLTNAVMENISSKLFMVLAKREKAEKLLAKLEREAEAREPEVEREGITEEERYMLKKVGLNMKPFLLLGRGVFDGTIENMHLHWKYRELVKIMASARGCDDVHGVAMTLEAESGGILVAVERVDRLCNYWKPVTTKVKLENPKVKNTGSLEFIDNPKATESHVSYLISSPLDHSIDDHEEDAVDISPLRRVNQAIYLLTTGAREGAFSNVKTIAVDLDFFFLS